MKIAFAGFGEVNTPVEVLERKCKKAASELQKAGAKIQSFYPIRDDNEEKDINAALKFFGDKDFDVLVLCIAGWIPSHAVIKVADRFRHKPMVLWGLCGWYENGRLITTADQAGTGALRSVLKELGIKFGYFYDICGRPSSAEKVMSFCRAAAAAQSLRTVRIGQLGYRDMQLYGTMFDGISLKRKVGAEIECFEMLEMVRRAEEQSKADVRKIIDGRMKKWIFLSEPDDKAMESAARYYLALKEIINERKFDAVSLKDVDGFKKLLGFPPAPVFTLLAEDGVCTIPENDCLGNVTQVMIKKLTGQIGAYLEFYEFFTDGVLAGVPDYVPKEIVEGQTTVLPAAFGELSQGLLNVSRVKTGKLTLCRLCVSDGEYCMHLITGGGTDPGKWEECGWTQPAPQLPGLKILIEDTERFADNVMGQHYIISYGDNTEVIKYLCQICGIKVIC